MAKIKIHVWHTVTGEIAAVGRPTSAAQCVPLSGDNQSVMETEIEEKDVQGLHRTHVVDVVRKVLLKQSGD